MGESWRKPQSDLGASPHLSESWLLVFPHGDRLMRVELNSPESVALAAWFVRAMLVYTVPGDGKVLKP